MCVCLSVECKVRKWSNGDRILVALFAGLKNIFFRLMLPASHPASGGKIQKNPLKLVIYVCIRKANKLNPFNWFAGINCLHSSQNGCALTIK